MMRPPDFWTRPRPTLAAHLLRPAAGLYGRIAAHRLVRPSERAGVPVICIGNFTLGGTGKTPTAAAVAELLREARRVPFFLTRGYGGSLAGPVLVDPARHSAAEVGDEPLLLARTAPTIVSRDRPAGARLAASLGADAIVMDDGLQNPSLAKDLSLAVVDGGTGFGNGLVFPAGPLRLAAADQWPLVQALVVIGEGAAGDRVAMEATRQDKAVVRAMLAPDPDIAHRLRGHRVLAFAGIGRPDKFFRTLEECGAVLNQRRPFPDHHPYTADEIAELLATAEAEGLVAVTTDKDKARLDTSPALRALSERIMTLPVRFQVEDEVAWRAIVMAGLAPAVN